MVNLVRESLLASNEQFRHLVQEHAQYSQRLDSLSQKPYLSEDDKLEQIRLKKLKLRLKDQMLVLEQQYLKSHPEHVA
jgi:hypothetical protein